MSSDDNIINQNRKKMPHMFQKSNLETTISVNDIDSIPHFQQNLTKIVKSYRSNVDKNVEIKTNSLMSNVKSLIEAQNTDVTKALYDYLEELRAQIGKVEEEIETVVSQEENLNVIETEGLSLEEVETEDSKTEVNFDFILQKTEKEILNSPDQKSVLKNLIDDININSSKKTIYNEEQFIKNMKDIMNENDDQNIVIEEDDIIEEIEQEYENPKTINMKGIVVFFFILVVVGLVGYLYKDIIVEFLQHNLNL